VQRFTLQDDGGNASEDKWQQGERLLLQRYLAELPNPANEPAIREFNETARAVRTEFGSQPSALFVPPAVKDTTRFEELPLMDPAVLDERYTAAICALRELLFKHTPAKSITRDGPPLTGPELADFAEAVLPAVNEGAGAFLGDRVLEGAAKQLVAICLLAYETEMSPDALKLPLDVEKLHEAHLGAKLAAVARFDAEMIGDKTSSIHTAYRTELQQATERAFSNVLSVNALKSAERCEVVASNAIASLQSHDFAGNVELFDFDAEELIAAAKSIPGPKGGTTCANRLRRDIRPLRSNIIATTLNARVIALTKSGAYVLIPSMLFVYAAGIFALPEVLIRVGKVVVMASFALCLLLLWSLDTNAPIPAAALLAVIDSLRWALMLAEEHWCIATCSAAACLLLLWKLRPKSPAAVAARLRATHAGIALANNQPAVIFVDNSPSTEYLRRTAEALYELAAGTEPLIAIGWQRRLGLSILPRTKRFEACVVGHRESIDTCQRWLTRAVELLRGHPPRSRDIRANWDDTHVTVFCQNTSLKLRSTVESNEVALADRLIQKCTH